MKRKVAIFDIDGTFFRSSLLIELVEVLIDKGIFPKSARAEYEKEQKTWINRHGPYDDYIDSVVDVFLRHIKGKEKTKIETVAETMMESHHHRTYKYTRNLIRELKDKGYYLLTISHSPKFVLDYFCKAHGFDKVYGTLYEVDENNKFTGTISHADKKYNKNEILHRAVEKENLTLEDSVGVGDTESDIKFLELVSKPICFNPNKALYEHAKAHNWLVVVERKDVIYEISGTPTNTF